MATLESLREILAQISQKLDGRVSENFKKIDDFKQHNVVPQQSSQHQASPNYMGAVKQLVGEIPGVNMLTSEVSKLTRLIQMLIPAMKGMSSSSSTQNEHFREVLRSQTRPLVEAATVGAAAGKVGWGREAAVALGAGATEAALIGKALSTRGGQGQGLGQHVQTIKNFPDLMAHLFPEMKGDELKNITKIVSNALKNSRGADGTTAEFYTGKALRGAGKVFSGIGSGLSAAKGALGGFVKGVRHPFQTFRDLFSGSGSAGDSAAKAAQSISGGVINVYGKVVHLKDGEGQEQEPFRDKIQRISKSNLFGRMKSSASQGVYDIGDKLYQWGSFGRNDKGGTPVVGKMMEIVGGIMRGIGKHFGATDKFAFEGGGQLGQQLANVGEKGSGVVSEVGSRLASSSFVAGQNVPGGVAEVAGGVGRAAAGGAGGVGTIVGEAAGAAEGGAAVAAGGAAGGVATAATVIGAVIGAFIALAAIATAVVVGLYKLSQAVAESQRYLAEYSGKMAIGFAISDYRTALRNIRSGESRGDSTNALLTQLGNLKDTLAPVFDKIYNGIAYFLAAIVFGMNYWAEKISAWMKSVWEGLKAIPAVGKYLQDWAASTSDFFTEMKTFLDEQMFKGTLPVENTLRMWANGQYEQTRDRPFFELHGQGWKPKWIGADKGIPPPNPNLPWA